MGRIAVSVDNTISKNVIHMNFPQARQKIPTELKPFCVCYMSWLGCLLASRFILWALFLEVCCLFVANFSFVTRQTIDYELPGNKTTTENTRIINTQDISLQTNNTKNGKNIIDKAPMASKKKENKLLPNSNLKNMDAWEAPLTKTPFFLSFAWSSWNEQMPSIFFFERY